MKPKSARWSRGFRTMNVFSALSVALCILFTVCDSLSISAPAEAALYAKSSPPIRANSSNSDTAEYYHYDIPYTTRTVYFCIEPYNYINVEAFDVVMMDALQNVSERISTYGDGPLQAHDMPYTYSVASECYLDVQSNIAKDGTPLMTYAMLKETLAALVVAMHYRVTEAAWQLQDLGHKPLGKGSIVERPYSAIR